jgi:hypothetical protein
VQKYLRLPVGRLYGVPPLGSVKRDSVNDWRDSVNNWRDSVNDWRDPE